MINGSLKNKKVKKVFLEGLPRWEDGIHKGKINWKETINSKVRFIYNGIEGEVEIISYEDKYLYVKYLDYEPFRMCYNSFSRCNFKNLLVIKKIGFVNEENNIITKIPIDCNTRKILWDNMVGKYIDVKYQNENNKIYIHEINWRKYSLSVSANEKTNEIKNILVGSFLKSSFGEILDKIKNYHIYIYWVIL